MQLAQPGRNEPCPCGSGRKYKKCCVDRQDAAAAGAAELDVAAVVSRAIDEDNWAAAHAIFDRGFVLFEPGAPLEHVRFRSDLVSAHVPDRSELPRLCGGGWLRSCEAEIGYVLDRVELDPRERDGLRLAAYTLGRFGARSPLVKALAELQAAEQGVRARTLEATAARLGLTAEEIDTGWSVVSAWLERARPAVLPFADWFALRTADDEQGRALWISGIASRVCDVSLVVLERLELPDALGWLQLAAIALHGSQRYLGHAIGALTPARCATAEERRVYDVLTSDEPPAPLGGAVAAIAAATEARGDFAGAALLRDAMHRVRSLAR